MRLKRYRQGSVRQVEQIVILYKQYDAERSCSRSGLQDVAFSRCIRGKSMKSPGEIVTYGTPSLAAIIDVQTKKGVPTTKSGLYSCRRTANQGSQCVHGHEGGLLQAIRLTLSWQAGACRSTCSSDIAAWSLSRASQAAPQILCTRRVCTA